MNLALPSTMPPAVPLTMPFTTPLRLDARQRAMLEGMGISMQGWPLAPVPASASASAPESGLDAPSAPAQVLDTQAPATRGMSLGQLQAQFKGQGQDPTPHHAASPAEISDKSAPQAEKPAWAATKNAAPKAKDEASLAAAAPPQALLLFDATGQALAQVPANACLLLCDRAVDATGQPLTPPALALLQNILRAWQLPDQAVVLSALLPAKQSGHLDEAALQPLRLHCQVQLGRWQPALVLAMGRVAMQCLLGGQKPLSEWRGQLHGVDGVAAPVLATYPLDYLLRTPAAKAKAWQDWLEAKFALQALKTKT